MINDYSDRHSKFTITTADGKSLQGIRIKPEKPVYSLIVVHGVGEHLKRYLSFAEKISSTNCTCYLYDQRGHGNSDGKRGHISKFDHYSNDLLEIYGFVKSESQKHPIFVYGHSMGSIVATLFALNNQKKIQGLLLTGFPFIPNIQISSFTLRVIKIMSKIAPLLNVPTMINVKDLSHDSNVRDTYEQDQLINKTVTLSWVAEFYSALYEFKKNLYKLELPVLIMHGSEDKITKLEGAKQAVQIIHSKDKTLQIFEGKRHELLNELSPTPDQVIGHMQDWIKLQIQNI